MAAAQALAVARPSTSRGPVVPGPSIESPVTSTRSVSVTTRMLASETRKGGSAGSGALSDGGSPPPKAVASSSTSGAETVTIVRAPRSAERAARRRSPVALRSAARASRSGLSASRGRRESPVTRSSLRQSPSMDSSVTSKGVKARVSSGTKRTRSGWRVRSRVR